VPVLSKEELLERVVTSVRLSGCTAIVLNDQHPFLIAATRRDDATTLRVYVWNITSGGPSTVRPKDERRIQITGVTAPIVVTNDAITLLLGWHEEIGVFAGYDVMQHRTFGSSPSLQVREATLEEAAKTGLAAQQRTTADIVVAFSPDQLMNYASRQAQLHQFKRDSEVEVLEAAASGKTVSDQDLDEVPMPRRQVVRTVQQWFRRRDFRARVLTAYEQQCAICNVQLELVEAAHIIPVGHAKGNDLTSNGLSLCPLHHEGYDGGLLGVWPDYHVRVNDGRLSELVARGLGSGEVGLRTLQCNTIFLPQRTRDRPRPDYLEEGLRLRGWSF